MLILIFLDALIAKNILLASFFLTREVKSWKSVKKNACSIFNYEKKI